MIVMPSGPAPPLALDGPEPVREPPGLPGVAPGTSERDPSEPVVPGARANCPVPSYNRSPFVDALPELAIGIQEREVDDVSRGFATGPGVDSCS